MHVPRSQSQSMSEQWYIAYWPQLLYVVSRDGLGADNNPPVMCVLCTYVSEPDKRYMAIALIRKVRVCRPIEICLCAAVFQ